MSAQLKVGDYVRNKSTGDLGVVIQEDGSLVIRPDSPLSPVRYPRSSFVNWELDTGHTKIPGPTMAVIAQAADRALCASHPELKKQPEWLSLSAEQKRDWIEGKVALQHPLRIALRDAVMSVLKGDSNG